jgi:predicted PurR-regulated permease PerM
VPSPITPLIEPPPRTVQLSGKPHLTPATLTVGFIGIAALYFARDVFVPLALAILLSFALGPLVVVLRRWHVGRVSSVIAVVIFAFLIIFGIGSLIGSQAAHFAENLPQYQSNIADKIHSLRSSTTGPGVIGRATNMLKQLGEEITRSTSPTAPAAGKPSFVPPPTDQPQRPVPVELRQPDPTALEVIQSVIGPLLQPLATTGLVVVCVFFFLLQREDLRDRFIRLVGPRDLHRTTRGLDDAAQRLSRYLLAQTAINGAFGVLIGSGLWIIGVPNALLCGILAMLLRYVPYIGPVIAAIFPATLGVAVDPGWSMLIWTGVLFIVLELIAGQAVEPVLYGHSTGLSAVAIVVAAAFWTWLWGPVGLLLSTPLTLCLVVLGRHVERLEFLDIILGDEPALSPEENFYQRMLANDPDEADHQAEGFLRDKPLSAYYDEVALRGLALAQLDVNRDLLEHQRRVQIKDAVLGVVDDLSDHAATPPPLETADQGAAIVNPGPSRNEMPRRTAPVLCVAGRGSLDEAAAAMLSQLLAQRGIASRVVPTDAVAASSIMRLETEDAPLICLSYLEAGGLTNARYLVRRLRRKWPGVPILIGFWTLTEEEVERRDAVRETAADIVVTSLRGATEQIAAIMAGHREDHADLPLQEASA